MVKTRDPIALKALLAAARNCRVCDTHLPLGPRPLFQLSDSARILIVGQAPGIRAHTSGIPWDDESGSRLRQWMGVSTDEFYDASKIAIIPMGLCYPGRGARGDLPPRRECAPLWLDRLLANLPDLQVTLLIGLHAQRHFLKSARKSSLTQTVKCWRDYGPRFVPLPHPSPRNNPWLKQNAWFESELVPELRKLIDTIK